MSLQTLLVGAVFYVTRGYSLHLEHYYLMVCDSTGVSRSLGTISFIETGSSNGCVPPVVVYLESQSYPRSTAEKAFATRNIPRGPNSMLFPSFSSFRWILRSAARRSFRVESILQLFTYVYLVTRERVHCASLVIIKESRIKTSLKIY